MTLCTKITELCVMFYCIIIEIYFKFSVSFHSLRRDIQMLAEHSRGGVGFPRAHINSRGGLSSLVLVHLTTKQALRGLGIPGYRANREIPSSYWTNLKIEF
jgi:hypothetical protein